MTDSLVPPTHEDAASPGGTTDAGQGWYLYGIIRSGGLVAPDASGVLPASADPSVPQPLEIVDQGQVAAIVRPLTPSDLAFDAGVPGEDTARVEEMLTSHNDVISLIHERRAIVPARFGSVYTSTDDLRSALSGAADELVAQLEAVEGCDEWAVHLFAGRDRLVETGAADARVQHLRSEIASARPGRAYFLRRQLEEERAAASGRAAVVLADMAYRRLSEHAAAGQVSALKRKVRGTLSDTEILHAAFLVPRDREERFRHELLGLEEEEGLRAEVTGPWAPYSFVALPEGEP